jgi:hypothetical protein
MNSFAAVVAAIPGPPLLGFPVNAVPALLPAGIALGVLAALGAIVVLLGRDARRTTGSVRHPRPVIPAGGGRAVLRQVA